MDENVSSSSSENYRHASPKTLFCDSALSRNSAVSFLRGRTNKQIFSSRIPVRFRYFFLKIERIREGTKPSMRAFIPQFVWRPDDRTPANRHPLGVLEIRRHFRLFEESPNCVDLKLVQPRLLTQSSVASQFGKREESTVEHSPQPGELGSDPKSSRHVSRGFQVGG